MSGVHFSLDAGVHQCSQGHMVGTLGRNMKSTNTKTEKVDPWCVVVGATAENKIKASLVAP